VLLLLLLLSQVGSSFSTWVKAYGITNATFLNAVSKRHEVDTEGEPWVGFASAHTYNVHQLAAKILET
jgi:hypothetical protein